MSSQDFGVHGLCKVRCAQKKSDIEQLRPPVNFVSDQEIQRPTLKQIALSLQGVDILPPVQPCWFASTIRAVAYLHLFVCIYVYCIHICIYTYTYTCVYECLLMHKCSHIQQKLICFQCMIFLSKRRQPEILTSSTAGVGTGTGCAEPGGEISGAAFIPGRSDSLTHLITLTFTFTFTNPSLRNRSCRPSLPPSVCVIRKSWRNYRCP